MSIPPFHLAFPVHDLAAARSFYGTVLNCPEGRSSDTWIDFDLYGHQIVAHYSEQATAAIRNSVDGQAVPIPHFGVVLPWEKWHLLAERLKGQNVSFVIEPYLRFEGQAGEQATMFFLDPSGNAIEFKAFKDPEELFRRG